MNPFLQLTCDTDECQPAELFASAQGEGFKGGIHLALCVLSSTCAAYNAGAYTCRPERRLGLNVGIYSLFAVYEAFQIRRHWKS